MGRICLGIYDKEGDYAKRLGRYIRRKGSTLMDVRVFTKQETLKKCLDSHGISLALISEDAKELCSHYEELWVAILAEERQKNYRYEPTFQASLVRESFPGERKPREFVCPFIEKYQSAEKIWKALLTLAGERIYGDEEALAVSGGTSFLAIASPVHRIGKTELARALGEELAFREKGRVLVISLEEFSSAMSDVSHDWGRGELSELYYYYSQKQLTPARICEACVSTSDMDFVLPVRNPEDLYPEGKLYPIDFFRTLAVCGGYRYLILDMGNTLAFREELLGGCQMILVPSMGPEDSDRVKSFKIWLSDLEHTGTVLDLDMHKDTQELLPEIITYLDHGHA